MALLQYSHISVAEQALLVESLFLPSLVRPANDKLEDLEKLGASWGIKPQKLTSRRIGVISCYIALHNVQ